MRIAYLHAAIALALLATWATAQVSPRARAVHASATVIDTHADTPQRFLDDGFDMGSTDPRDTGQISLEKARLGNLSAEFFSIWVYSRPTAAITHGVLSI